MHRYGIKFGAIRTCTWTRIGLGDGCRPSWKLHGTDRRIRFSYALVRADTSVGLLLASTWKMDVILGLPRNTRQVSSSRAWWVSGFNREACAWELPRSIEGVRVYTQPRTIFSSIFLFVFFFRDYRRRPLFLLAHQATWTYVATNCNFRSQRHPGQLQAVLILNRPFHFQMTDGSLLESILGLDAGFYHPAADKGNRP